jgi:Obg family GTPase CgtA-like protein
VGRVNRRSGHHFDVTGVAIARFAKMTNWELDDAIDRFQRVLAASGISGELERQGIGPGDVVRLAGREFVWGEHDEPERPRCRTAAARTAGVVEDRLG